MNSSPLLSIIIATKNRPFYCMKAIESILFYDFTDFELVIQDNTDDLELHDLIQKEIKDNRLVYNYTPPPFSSIDNFNKAISLAKGKYVCLIGDDDSVLENLFHVVLWAEKNGIDSISPKQVVNYVWPNGNMEGKMVFPYSSRKSWRNNPAHNIQKLVNDGIVNYSKFDLPKLYHGVIKKELLEKLKSKTGFYLGGLSPDIYASVALTSVVKIQLVLDFPITIAGACPKSTTVANSEGKHSGKLEDAPHLRNKEDYIWEKEVPRFYSVQTIWAETAVKAVKEHNIKVDLSQLNYFKILSGAINDSPRDKDFFLLETLKVANLKHGLLFRFILYIYRFYLKSIWFFQAVKYRIPRKRFFRHIRKVGVTEIGIVANFSNSELSALNTIQILERESTLRRKDVV